MNDMMNLTTTTMTMSSLEIAKVTGKRHDHVLRDIEKMVEELSEHSPSLGSQLESTTYADSNNIQRKKYVLDKELTITLTAGYSVVQRNAIVKRWLELEGQQKPMTLGDTLVAQAEAFREVERQLALVQAQQSETSTLLGQTSTRLDQIETAGEHFTIIGWSRLNGRTVTLPMASSMGGKATKYCKERGIQTGSVPDARFGRANTYPKNVLDYLFTGDEGSN